MVPVNTGRDFTFLKFAMDHVNSWPSASNKLPRWNESVWLRHPSHLCTVSELDSSEHRGAGLWRTTWFLLDLSRGIAILG